MDELKEMMRDMAEKIRDKAKDLGMKNISLMIEYAQVTDGYEISEIECTKRTLTCGDEPGWYFIEYKHRDEEWADHTHEYRRLLECEATA